MKKTLGIGVIGAGFMGKTHTYNYRSIPLFYEDFHPKLKLVGICDTDPGAARRHRDRFDFEFATEDYRELLKRDDIDIVDVSTPTRFHFRQTMDALKAGKHVYVDKPLCMSVDEGRRLVECAARCDCVNQVAYHYRFFPGMLKTKELLENGSIGRPIFFRAVYYHSSSLDPDRPATWKEKKALGGGMLNEMACHLLDLMYYFLGEYRDVFMRDMILYPDRPDRNGGRMKVDVEDHVSLSVAMKNGALGSMDVSRVAAGTNDDLDFEIYGTEGAVKYRMMDPNFLYVYDRKTGGTPGGGQGGFVALETINKYADSSTQYPGPRFAIGWLRGHVASQYNFVKNAASGTPAVPSIKDAYYTQLVTHRIYSKRFPSASA